MSVWKLYRLSDFIEINPKVSLSSSIEHPFIEMKDLNENQKYVIPAQIRKLKGGARFQNGDTLFARITPCLENGKICQVKGLTEKAGFGSTELLVFRGKEKLSSTDFVYYLSRYDVVRKFAEQNMVGTSGRQRVSKEAFNNIELELPDISTQTAIAFILSSFDDKIELNNAINKNLEDLAQALFKHWFVDFEFPNENGEPYKSSGGEMVESELGEIPKGWRIGRFGELAEIINGYAFKSSDFQDSGENRILKIRNINGKDVDIKNTQFVSDKVVSHILSKYQVKEGQILIAMTGAEVGKIGIVPKTQKELWLNQRVGRIEPAISSSSVFIHTFFNYFDLTKEVRNSAMGSAQPNISATGIESVKCIVPNQQMINAFSVVMNDYFTFRIESLYENEQLETLRNTLLPKLISGELEVNEVLSQTEKAI